jgi:hypothetical protein
MQAMGFLPPLMSLSLFLLLGRRGLGVKTCLLHREKGLVHGIMADRGVVGKCGVDGKLSVDGQSFCGDEGP